MLSPEEIYMLLRDQSKTIQALTTRVDALEFFIREKFPGDIAGEAYDADYKGPVVADDLNPITLNLGALVSDLRDPNKEVQPILVSEDAPG